MKADIRLVFEVDSPADTKRIQDMLHTLYQSGVFDTKGGVVQLHFDKIGTLMRIEGNLYTRKASVPILSNKPLTQTTSR